MDNRGTITTSMNVNKRVRLRGAAGFDNLPLQLTSFIGRERDIRQIMQLLAGLRLLTLTGAGGVGKTRLSLEVADNLLDRYAGGVWLVDIGSLNEPDMVVHKTASTLDVGSEGAKPRIKALVDFLADKELLLILDNCEHLVEACAEMVNLLLQSCIGLRVLATSREPLAVPGETVYEVQPLEVPEESQPITLEMLAGSEAVKLFIERAQAFQPGFELNEGNAAAATHICRLVDGLPLAIELAAARVRAMSPLQIADNLKDNLHLLKTGVRTAITRQQTLHDCIEWSHDLLTEPEKVLFRRLSVFAGQFTLDDVSAVCSDESCGESITERRDQGEMRELERNTPIRSSDLLDLLCSLVDKSLVSAAAEWDTSYRMLNPVRQFAWEELDRSGEKDALRDQHLCHYLTLAEQAHPAGKHGEQPAWMKRVELELDNFRAALDWALQSDAYASGLRISCDLGEFWWRHGYGAEGLVWLNRLLATNHPEDRLRAGALLLRGRLFSEVGDYEQAKSCVEESMKLCQELEYREGIAEAISRLGIIAHFGGDSDLAIELLMDGIVLFKELGDDWNVASKQLYLADVQMRSGKLDQAEVIHQDNLKRFETLCDNWGTAFALGGLGEIARRRGENELALKYLREGLAIQIELENKMDITYVIEAIALVLGALERYMPAARLWGFTEALRERIHSFVPQSYIDGYVRHQDEIRTAIGDSAFQTAWQEGRAISVDQAVALTMEVESTDAPSPQEAIQEYGLTAREIEVLKLVASGLTDAQVGEVLYISPRTVSKHLQSVYGKIQVSTRSAATRFALEHDLV